MTRANLLLSLFMMRDGKEVSGCCLFLQYGRECRQIRYGAAEYHDAVDDQRGACEDVQLNETFDIGDVHDVRFDAERGCRRFGPLVERVAFRAAGAEDFDG
jgi:hypothetical protein